MSEPGLDDIVQITVEDFHQEDRTGKNPVKQHENCYCWILMFSVLLFRYGSVSL